MTRTVMWGFAGFGLICTFLAAVNVTLVLRSHDDERQIAVLRQKQADEETARVAARRVDIDSGYERCLLGIQGTTEANLIIRVISTEMQNAAVTDEKLAAASINPAYQRLHRQQARGLRQQALALRPFPTVTRAECLQRRADELKQFRIPPSPPPTPQG